MLALAILVFAASASPVAMKFLTIVAMLVGLLAAIKYLMDDNHSGRTRNAGGRGDTPQDDAAGVTGRRS